MSAVSPLVQNGLLAQLVADSTAEQTQLDQLTQQSASGQVAETYGGLGDVAHVSIDLRPQMAEIGAWQQNIATANTQLSTTQSVLNQLSSIASTFDNDALGTAMDSASGAATVATQAQSALQQVVSLLNQQSDGQYPFGGAASQTPPIDTNALSTFSAAVSAEVGGLDSATDISTLVGNIVTDAAASSFACQNTPLTRPGSAAIEAQVGAGLSVPVAFVAGVNSYAQQNGTGTTGSCIRDLVAGLAGLAGLANTQATQPTLQSYGTAIAQLLQGAGNALATEEAGFGQVQQNLTTQGTNLSDTLNTLTTQVSGVEDVNMTATATALSQVQTQLQASYKLIAELPDLSLVNFMSS
jgi:flagellar hook-associated protein 3 FlgL